ncbi:MAG: DUF4388 domain-containing protein [Acidobacteriota bacterium]|jgi:hypothetical protein
MSFSGRLETLELPALLQTLGAGNSTGRLTLTRLDQHAVIVLREGRVVYGGGGARSETLAGRLLRQGLVGEANLVAALEAQHDGGEFRPLGDVLAEMGVLAEGTLESVVRQRLQELIAELLGWDGGYFRFEPTPPQGELEVDLGDFVVPDGVAPMELLMHAMTTIEGAAESPPESGETSSPRTAPSVVAGRAEPRTAPPESPETPAFGTPGPVSKPDLTPAPVPRESPPPRRDATPTLSESGSYTADFSGEVVLLLLRLASQILTRAVVFAVEGERLHGVGEFGVTVPGRSAAQVVGDTVLPVREPSFLRVAVEEKRAHLGPLEPTRLNLKLVKRLGGILPREAIAVPLMVRGDVHLVLYGDNGSEERPIGPLDVLEGAVARAARILERTLAARERKG